MASDIRDRRRRSRPFPGLRRHPRISRHRRGPRSWDPGDRRRRSAGQSCPLRSCLGGWSRNTVVSIARRCNAVGGERRDRRSTGRPVDCWASSQSIAIAWPGGDGTNIPPHAKIERQLAVNLPVVLEECGVVAKFVIMQVAGRVRGVERAGEEAVGGAVVSEKEVPQFVPRGYSVVERIFAEEVAGVVSVESPPLVVRAYREGMRATDVGQSIAVLPHWVVAIGVGVVCAAEARLYSRHSDFQRRS